MIKRTYLSILMILYLVSSRPAVAVTDHSSPKACGTSLISSPARIRGRDGRMKAGVISAVSSSGESYLVRTAEGEVRVPVSRLFASRETSVMTPNLKYYWSTTYFELTADLIAFLDEGARVVDGVAADGSSNDVARAVVGYVRRKITPDVYTAKNPPFSVDQMLKSGRGGCVHFALLTAAVLAEAGYAPNLVRVAGTPGHIWLELQAARPSGRVETLIVDASAGSDVKSFGQHVEDARRDSDGLAKTCYTNSNRIYEMLSQ